MWATLIKKFKDGYTEEMAKIIGSLFKDAKQKIK